MKVRRTSAISMPLLLLTILASSHAQERGWEAQGVRTTMVVSRESVLPYTSVSVLLVLRNETAQPKRIVASWRSFMSVGEITPQGVEWRSYHGDNEPFVKPPAPSAKNFAPGETEKLFAHIDYEAPSGKPVFERPGRYLLKGSASDDGRFVSDEVEIIVRRPTGIDAKAYEFLQTNNIHHFFSEFTTHKYEYDRKTVQAIEKFITDFDGSEYSHLARIGLAFLWLRGVEGKKDEPRAVELLTQVAEQAGAPLSSEAEYHLGSILARRGDTARANHHFQKVMTRMPPPYFRYLAEQALRQR